MEHSEKDVLDFLMHTAEGISKMFGYSCETLIHDMSKPGHPIIAIYNGHVSGRKIGSTADIFGCDLTSMGKSSHFKPEKDIINSLVVTKNGKYIKSTTLNYIGNGYHYALGINLDYTALNGAISLLEGMVKIDQNLNDAIDEYYSNTQLEDIFNECLAIVGKPVESMKKADRIQIIALLMQHNAFNFQKSITYVAERLNVSRYSVYKYRHEIEENLNN